ncbi:hypothetical protein [Pseudomonas laurylsulfatiphila]|uniref:hypothetical protein n=1 Tax=Pseudomonas laurylsulfatiphila TaxID=2011015 RepID=UPI003D1DB874
MHIEVIKAPPNKIIGVALENMRKGRYEVNAKDFIEEMDTEAELRTWLKYCKMIPMLIERVVADLKDKGVCVLRFKGIIIRDTEWRDPVKSINWSTIKLPTFLN